MLKDQWSQNKDARNMNDVCRYLQIYFIYSYIYHYKSPYSSQDTKQELYLCPCLFAAA